MRFAIVFGCLAIALAQGQQDPLEAELPHARLYEIARSKTFYNVNRNDARAALKLWGDIVARQKGFLLDYKVDIVDTVGELVGRLGSHSADMLVIGVTELMELEARQPRAGDEGR